MVSSKTNDCFEYPIISGGIEPMGNYNKFNRYKDTITVARAGAAGYVSYQEKDFYLNDKCFSLSPLFSRNNEKFFYYSLVSRQQEIEKLQVASAVPTINTAALGSFEICYSNNDKEKELISSFLTALDKNITLHQRES